MSTIKDIINRIDNSSLRLYPGTDINPDSPYTKGVMLVTHEFTRTGAPSALLQLANALTEQDCTVFVLCHMDGVLRSQFTDAGIHVIVYENYIADKNWISRLKNCFDLWVINTLITAPLFYELNDTDENIVWWLHESEFLFMEFARKFPLVTLGKNSHILAASPLIERYVRQYLHADSFVLNIGISDAFDPAADCTHNLPPADSCTHRPIRFLQVGTIDRIKGQEYLAAAIEQLSPAVRSQCDFTFCGNINTADSEILSAMQRTADKYPNVHMMDSLSHEQLLALYDTMDVIVVSSVMETTSAVMAECLMKKKIGICSDACGIVQYLSHGENALIFQNQNSADLAEKITYAVQHFTELDKLRDNGRLVYEAVYAAPLFYKNIHQLLDWAFSHKNPIRQQPLVSILIYACNAKSGLLRTLRSVYSQIYTHFEVVIVDDASNDNTLAAVTQFFGEKENLFYTINDVHLGIGNSLSSAASSLHGTYTAFIEAGDEWTEDALERRLELLCKDSAYDGVYGITQKIETDKLTACPPINEKTKKYLSGDIRPLFAAGIPVYLGSVMVKTKLFEKENTLSSTTGSTTGTEFVQKIADGLHMGFVPYTVLATERTYSSRR